MASKLLEKAQWLYKNGMNELALNLSNEILKANPNNIDALEQRAKIFVSLDFYRNAIEDYTAILKLEAESLIRLNRGDSYYKLGQLKAALDDYSMYIEQNQDDPIGYFKRGLIHSEIELEKEALNDFNSAIEYGQDENNHETIIIYQAKLSRAVIYEKQEKYIHALSDLDDAFDSAKFFMDLFPTSAHVVELILFKVRLLRKLGEFENALNVINDVFVQFLLDSDNDMRLWQAIQKERRLILSELGYESCVIDHSYLSTPLKNFLSSSQFSNAMYN